MRQFIDAVEYVNKKSLLKEYLHKTEIPEKITVDGKLRWTKNSDGKLIHSTIQGIENFWKWFGDSKVVDNTGKPLVVYHGGNDGIGEFDTDGMRDSAGAGTYFTTDEDIAKQYANGRQVYAAYLKIVNIYHQDWDGRRWDAGNNDEVEFDEFDEPIGDWYITTDEFSRRMRSRGYDGVGMYNVSDDLEGGGYGSESDIYVVYKPNQIKSIDNNGDFSEKSNYIKESNELPEKIKVNGKERPTRNSNNQLIHSTIEGITNFWKWFDDSKLIDKQGRPVVVYHGTDYEFEDFDESHLEKNFGTSSINGFWFTNDKYFAEQYGSNIKMAYLKIHTPTNTRFTREPHNDSFIEYPIKSNNPPIKINNKELKKNNAVLYCVFSKNQIKSATDNNGDFSNKSNKINESEINNYTMKDILKYGYKDLNTSSKIFSNSIVEKLAVKNNVESKDIIVFVVDGVYKYFLKPSKKLTESEEIPETIKVNGKERPTRNSNNKLIHPTIQGIENFWMWFNESTVIDGQGRPMVVYHGTGADFDSFQKKNTGAGSRESHIGFWFTENPSAASDFAVFAARGKGANIKPLYIKIENPLFIKEYDEIRDIVDKHTVFTRPNYVISGRNIRMIDDKVDYVGVKQDLESSGHDGLILNNTLVDSPDGSTRINQYITLSEKQIKSAIGNNGEFSPNSNKITEAAPTEQLKSMIYYHGTASKDAAMNILKNGIQAPELETKRGSQLTPVKGRVYITPKLSYAMIYAIGMSGAFGSKSYQVPYEGNEDKFKHVFSSYVGKNNERYGYVFTIDGNQLHDIQPDEDEVGELYNIIKTNSLDWYSSRESDISVRVYEKIQKNESLQRRFVYFFETVVGNYTLKKILDGEYAYYASGGKTALKKMPDEMKLELAQLGIHLSHGGTIIPKECWEIDKTLIGYLKEDGSNFFELAKKLS